MKGKEKVVSTMQVYGSGCMGCKRHGKYILISYQEEGSDKITDLFLTEEKSNELLNNLRNRMEDNIINSFNSIDIK